MRVCHFSSVHPRFDTRIFYKELKSLSKIAENLFWIVADNKGNDLIDGIKIIDVGAHNSRLKRFLFTSVKIYKTAKKLNCDIYHFHDPELLIVALFLKVNGKKVIYDVHEDVPNDILIKNWITPPIRLLISKLVRNFENFAASKMSLVITVTPYLVNRFKKINKNTIPIYNFPVKDELISSIKADNDLHGICYIGSITRERGIYQMLDSLEYASVKLRLAGTFENADTSFRSMNHRNWNSVLYYGYADRETVKIILKDSIAGIVVLLPTKTHLFSYPVKLFEYMSASIPVIASDFPVWKEIIESNQCGICVDPENPQKIAEAINLLIDNKDQAIEMGRNGRKAIEKKYNWELQEIELLNTYKSLYHDRNNHYSVQE